MTKRVEDEQTDREKENETRRSEWLAGPTKKGIAANSPC